MSEETTPQPLAIASPHAATTAQLYPASLFRRYENNRTISGDQIDAMRDSIAELGVLQPITGRWREDDATQEKYLEVVIGESRWLGCHAISDEFPVPVFIRDLSDKEAAKINAVENFQRHALDAIQEGRAIANMKEQGWTHDEIEHFLGVKKDYIYDRLSLLKLEPAAQEALREGNITLKTASCLVSVPKDSQAAALKALVEPVHSKSALPQREAIQLLDRDFIQPAKQADEWESRRDALLDIHRGAKWLTFDEAHTLGGWNSGYVAAANQPSHNVLSDAARSGELVIPTWEELAKRHGAEIVIGCSWQGEARIFTKPQPIIDAEKAACAQNPGNCIFVHEDAVHQQKQEAEKRKLEREAERAARVVESKKIGNLILSPDGLTKTATKKLVEAVVMNIIDNNTEYDALDLLFDIEEIDGEEFEGQEKRREAALVKYLRSKAFSPFEALGRIQIAAAVVSDHWACDYLFDAGVIKPADFPAYHKLQLEHLQEAAAKESAEKERQAQRAADDAARALAAGEDPGSPDDSGEVVYQDDESEDEEAA